MIQLHHGDCLEVMKQIPDKSVDLVLTDLPYGTTACSWDVIVPLAQMWAEIGDVAKDNAAIVLFGAEPFSSRLRMSKLNWYKYDWIWKKDKATGHLNAKKQPMRQTEQISVFYSEQCCYEPQLEFKRPEDIRPATNKRKNTGVYGDMAAESERGIPVEMAYPKNILTFNSCFENGDKGFHPTQKPVDLLEYLIKTYTKENETVLDFTMGSGSTGVACKHLNRSFIGIEKDETYFNIAKKRIENAQMCIQTDLFEAGL